MSKEIKDIVDMPVIDPNDDDSSGMKLVDRKDLAKPKGETASHPGNFEYTSFKDWLKTANSTMDKK